MNIVKEGAGERAEAVGAEHMAQINALSRRELKPQEVYTFCVRLCDNEVDRDGERFAPETLEQLRPMFEGKSGIFDHAWSARGQSARIYRCELVREDTRLTRAGDPYCWLKGYAYMLRSEGNRELIDEIDAGIKKEVSVGCSVAHKVCSVCGQEVSHLPCEHKRGSVYDGRLCYVSLEEAVDAYEFSFVAVPAQPAAGVVKGLEYGCADLKTLAERHPACLEQLRKLEELAEVGRESVRQMGEEVVRLGLLSGLELEAEQLREMVKALSPAQLSALKQAYELQAKKQYPLHTQLQYEQPREQENRQRDEAFLI